MAKTLITILLLLLLFLLLLQKKHEKSLIFYGVWTTTSFALFLSFVNLENKKPPTYAVQKEENALILCSELYYVLQRFRLCRPGYRCINIVLKAEFTAKKIVISQNSLYPYPDFLRPDRVRSAFRVSALLSDRNLLRQKRFWPSWQTVLTLVLNHSIQPYQVPLSLVDFLVILFNGFDLIFIGHFFIPHLWFPGRKERLELHRLSSLLYHRHGHLWLTISWVSLHVFL